MKNINFLLFLSLTLFFLSSHSVRAQSKVSVYITQSGALNFTIEKPRFFISISDKGDITGYSIRANGPVSYNLNGRVESVGGVKISYDFDGRVDRIDDERISYDFENRIKQIGDTQIRYDLRNRLESVGEEKVSYDIHGRVEKISSASISYNLSGKIERINNDGGFLYFNLAY